MRSSLEEVRQAVMDLPDGERQLLAEEIIAARWNPRWRAAWSEEIDRRRQRLANGDDGELTLDQFLSDDDID
jgi:hypothetical protein